MRRVAIAAMVLTCGHAGAAVAQSLTPAAALAEAAFRDDFIDMDGRRAAGELRWRPGDPTAEVLPIRLGGTLSFATRDFALDLSPHAGVSTEGGQAGAGALVEIRPKSREERAVEQLKDMGVRDGTEFGDRGRWYLFAAASGRAVGLNMLRDDRGWDRAGWSTDPTGALVGDAQIGVGWRKGDLQTSFGVIHREVRGNHMVFAQHTREDTVAAFTLSIRPQD